MKLNGFEEEEILISTSDLIIDGYVEEDVEAELADTICHLGSCLISIYGKELIS